MSISSISAPARTVELKPDPMGDVGSRTGIDMKGGNISSSVLIGYLAPLAVSFFFLAKLNPNIFLVAVALDIVSLIFSLVFLIRGGATQTWSAGFVLLVGLLLAVLIYVKSNPVFLLFTTVMSSIHFVLTLTHAFDPDEVEVSE